MKLSVKEKIGYGLGDTASNFVWALMMNFIMYFYTDIYGITAAMAGNILLVARTADGFIDFSIGAVADRTNSRWGRFRPYMLYLCVPLALLFILAFTTPNFSDHGKLIWAWVTYNLLMFMYSAINIPYGALSGVMTDDPADRTSLNSFRMGLAQVGGLIANSFFFTLIAFFGRGNKPLGAQLTVVFFSILLVIFFLIAFATTKERIQPPAGQKTKLWDDVKTLFENNHWKILAVVGIVNITLAVVRGSTIAYYCKSYLGWQENPKFWLDPLFWFYTSGGLSMIVGAFLTKFFIMAMGKKMSFIVSMLGVGLTAIPFYWFAPDQTFLVFATQIVGTMFAGVNATLFWALIADTADFAEWKFNVRTTGIIFSAATFAQKVGMGVGGKIMGWFLDMFHYVPKAAQQSEEALRGIRLMFSFIPAVGLIILAFFFFLYTLTEDKVASIREDLLKRRAAQ